MKTWHDRLAHALTVRGKGWPDLVKATGLAKPSVYAWKPDTHNQTKMLTADNAVKVCEWLGINHKWLFENSGASGLESPAEEIEAAVPAAPAPPSGAVFDLLDVEAACGDGKHNADYPEIVRSIVLSDAEARNHVGSLNKAGSIRVIVATGDSMTPTIQPRDLLFVDTAVTEFSGDGVYLIRRDHGLSCKRLSMAGRTLLVTSDNPVARDWKWKDKRESDAIIGRVLAALPMTFKQFY